MIWWFIWMSLWIRRHILVAYFSSSEKWLLISLRCSPRKLETESWVPYTSYSTNTQCKFDDYHSECFKLIQQLITDRNLILILFLHLGCISLHPQLKKKKYKEFFRISYQLVSSKRVQNGILMWSLQIYIQIYLIYALSAGVCVCVCVYIHKIHWLFYSLFIQLTCIMCSLLTDRCEDKNHLPMRSIQVTEKMVMYPKGKEDQTS